ncbi:MAG: hypothetical protein ACK5PP_10375, partial [Acidimicrobiales bacterium]
MLPSSLRIAYDRLIDKTPAAVLSVVATLLLLWLVAASRPDPSTRAVAAISASRPDLTPSQAQVPLTVRTSTGPAGLWALASSALADAASATAEPSEPVHATEPAAPGPVAPPAGSVSREPVGRAETTSPSSTPTSDAPPSS